MSDKINALNGIYRYDPDSKAAPRVITLRPDLTCDLHAVDPSTGEQRMLTIGTYAVNWGPTIELTWTQRPSINVPKSENYALIDDLRTLTRMGGGYLRYKGPADTSVTGPAAPLIPHVSPPPAVLDALQPDTTASTAEKTVPAPAAEDTPPADKPGINWGKWIATGAVVGGSLAIKGLQALAKEIEKTSPRKDGEQSGSGADTPAPTAASVGEHDPRVVGAFTRTEFYSSSGFSGSSSVTRVLLPDGRFFITSSVSADYTNLSSGAGVSVSKAAESGFRSAGRDSRGRWSTRGKLLHLDYDDGDVSDAEYSIDGGNLVLWIDGKPQIWER